eukprot:11836226-Karenia_brevis.AAC.1
MLHDIQGGEVEPKHTQHSIVLDQDILHGRPLVAAQATDDGPVPQQPVQTRNMCELDSDLDGACASKHMQDDQDDWVPGVNVAGWVGRKRKCPGTNYMGQV